MEVLRVLAVFRGCILRMLRVDAVFRGPVLLQPRSISRFDAVDTPSTLSSLEFDTDCEILQDLEVFRGSVLLKL